MHAQGMLNWAYIPPTPPLTEQDVVLLQLLSLCSDHCLRGSQLVLQLLALLLCHLRVQLHTQPWPASTGHHALHLPEGRWDREPSSTTPFLFPSQSDGCSTHMAPIPSTWAAGAQSLGRVILAPCLQCRALGGHSSPLCQQPLAIPKDTTALPLHPAGLW